MVNIKAVLTHCALAQSQPYGNLEQLFFPFNILFKQNCIRGISALCLWYFFQVEILTKKSNSL
jgi:hypothetical protein